MTKEQINKKSNEIMKQRKAAAKEKLANKGKKVSRVWIRNRIKEGKVLVKCDFHLTDDYAWDAANKNGKTDWMEAVFIADSDDFIEGKMNFQAWDFGTKSGHCSGNRDEVFHFSIHSNLHYSMKLK